MVAKKLTTIQMLNKLQHSSNTLVASKAKKILSSGDVIGAIYKEKASCGGFMYAVLDGNYTEALARADHENHIALTQED